MGIFLIATVLLVVACFTFGAEFDIVVQIEPQTEEDIGPDVMQAAKKPSANPCISKKTCTDCIRAHPDCAWCASQDMDYTAGRKKRCNYAKIIRDECGTRDIVNISNTWEELSPQNKFNAYLRKGGSYSIIAQHSANEDETFIGYRVVNPPKNVQVTYSVKCSEDKPEEETNFCLEVKQGQAVEAKITFKLRSCPKNREKWNQTIELHEWRGTRKHNFKVNLHMLCECECEKPWNEEWHSPKCSERGTYRCGVCSCYGNRYGKRCECEAEATGVTDDDEKLCIAPRDTKICSGRGRCHCGICECFNETSVTGRFCECDSHSCPRSEDGQICGGKDRGKCECGKCKCTDEWTGPACDCTKDTKACRSPYNLQICHGLGECKCGKCQCFAKDGIVRSGRYCEDCHGCSMTCERYKCCGRCLQFH